MSGVMSRLGLIALFSLLPAGAWAQSRSQVMLKFPPAGPSGPPAPGIRPGHSVHPVRPVRPGIWGWGWGSGWANPGTVRVVVEPAPEKEKAAPPYVTNKEWVAERLTPRMTEITAAPAAPAPADWKRCNLKLTSGESFEAASCAEVDDTLLVRSDSGRRYRFSRDLIASLRHDQ
jgi:hypothetical protein